MIKLLNVSDSGITDDLLSHHYTIFSVRKKNHEHHFKQEKIVRDYSKFHQKDFKTLVNQSGWEVFDILLDPNIQWDILITIILNILAIMCPLK